MQNPWLNLVPDGADYLLDMDREAILSYNQKVNPNCRVVIDSIPEPFIGNPESARVVLTIF